MAQSSRIIDISQAVAVYDSYPSLIRALRDGTVSNSDVRYGSLVKVDSDGKFLANTFTLVDTRSKAIDALYNASRDMAIKVILETTGSIGKKGYGQVKELFILYTAVVSARLNISYVEEAPGPHIAIMPLDYYIRNGGDCKRFSLAAAAILQRFKEDGYIDGSVRIMGNQPRGEEFGHAWLRYENGNRRVIVDPTNVLLFEYEKTAFTSKRGLKKRLGKGNPDIKVWNYLSGIDNVPPRWGKWSFMALSAATAAAAVSGVLFGGIFVPVVFGAASLINVHSYLRQRQKIRAIEL